MVVVCTRSRLWQPCRGSCGRAVEEQEESGSKPGLAFRIFTQDLQARWRHPRWAAFTVERAGKLAGLALYVVLGATLTDPRVRIASGL